jgi:HEXXH motif-containing protein
MIPTAFPPDPLRGAACDRAMCGGLRDSLRYLAEVTANEAPQVGAVLAGLADFPALAAPRPEAFARYYRMTRALLENRIAAALDEAQRLAALPARDGDRLLVAGTPAAAEVVALLSDGGDALMDLAPVPADDAAAFARLLDEGRALMARELPDLHGEISAIVNTVLLGHGQPGAAMEFDGASHYQFWGLLVLNPRHHRTPLAVAEVLAHEAGHSLLFGLSVDEPMVLNPDEELYASPLRRDPRPMDGIFHATFVSARMAFAMERLAASPNLSAADRAAAAAAAATDRRNFAAGDAVVREHGQLTATGAAVIEAARAWIGQPVAA